MTTQKRKQIAHGDSVSASGSAVTDPALLKRHQLAKAINTSVRTVDNLQAKKIIPAIKISPRMVRFHLPSVLRALERFTVKEAK